MKKLVALPLLGPLLGLLLIPALPAEAQSDRGNDRSIEKKLDMVLRRLEMLEQRVNRSDGGPQRRMKQRRMKQRRMNQQHSNRGNRDAAHGHKQHDADHRGPSHQGRGPMGFGSGPHQNGPQNGPRDGHMGHQNAGARRGPPANAKFGPQMLGKLPEIMRAAMQGDARAQKMLGKLHQKIGSVLKASKNSTIKTTHVDTRRRKVMAVEVDRRRVQLEIARREMIKRQGKQQRYEIVVTDKAPAQAKKTGHKKAKGRDVERMRELTRKSRQLQEEIRRLRAELSKMK